MSSDILGEAPASPRRRLRAARRELGPFRQRAHAAAAARRLARIAKLRNAKRIALYRASDGELDPAPLMARLPRGGRHWYLPVLHPFLPGRLWFARYRPADPMRPNRFGIQEPARRRGQLCAPRSLQLVLLPLVGFDASGNRIGMGGGFYDRSFAFLRKRRQWHRPRLVGLAHECQRVDAIEPRPWDVPLDAVVTEHGIDWREGRGTSDEGNGMHGAAFHDHAPMGSGL